MITDKSTPEEIIQSMLSDHSHVEYQLKKSYGGSAKYSAASDQLMDECKAKHKKFLLGNIECYRSGFTGNNWMAYHYCKEVQNGLYHYGIGSFVYWDTEDGSIAAAVTVTNKDKSRSAIIFSGHFFQRYAEREQLGDIDLDIVCNFFYNNICPVIQAYSDINDGEQRFDIALHRGIGRGHTIGYSGNGAIVFSVKTYLPTSMLNASQRELTAFARDRRASVDRPADALCNAFFNHDENAMCDLCEDIYRAKGMEPGFGHRVGSLLMHIIGIGICRACIKPDANLRKLFIELYNKHIDVIFAYVGYNNTKKSFTYGDMAAVCKIANPDFNVADVFLYAIMYMLEQDNVPSKINYQLFESLVKKVDQGIDITPDIISISPKILEILD